MKTRFRVQPVTAASEDIEETIDDRYKDLVSNVSDDIDYLLDSIDKVYRDGDANVAIDLLNQVKVEIDSIIANTVSNISAGESEIE